MDNESLFERGPCVSEVREKAVGSRVSKEKAKSSHRKAGFSSYSGPLLKGDRFVLDYGASGYPQAFMSIPRPPKQLFCIGSPEALTEGLAVIGARKATPYGLGCAARFARQAARRGICIISGGARGCDARAHRAAIEEGAPTVVFLGGGCDQIYPHEHYSLFQQVIDTGGAVVSEREWTFPPMPYAFRDRNRLIAGLAKATLIVEAGLPSGTFSTADEALNASKDVLVVPGSITSPTSAGSNRLLCQGAMPVVDDESFQECLFQLFGCLKEQLSNDRMHSIEDPLLAAIMANPSHAEDLFVLAQGLCGSEPPVAWLTRALSQYEMRGLIARYPDGRYGPIV